MPFYDYKCEKCDHAFEEMLAMKDRKKPERKNCPSCGEKGTVKQWIRDGAGVAVDAKMRIDGKATGGFRDALEKVIQAPGIKGSKREKYLRTRYGM
jgi:putative FmdB family regulatory protein